MSDVTNQETVVEDQAAVDQAAADKAKADQAAADEAELAALEAQEAAELATKLAAEKAAEEAAKAPAAPVKLTARKAQAPLVPQVSPTAGLDAEVALTFAEAIAGLEYTSSSSLGVFIDAVSRYLDEMAPGKVINSDKGARQQYALWRAIQTVINQTPNNEFKAVWAGVLAIFASEQDGAFNDRYLYRFSESWAFSVAELKAFFNMCNLLKLTAVSTTREASLKQVDLLKTLAFGLTEDGRQRLLAFYGK